MNMTNEMMDDAIADGLDDDETEGETGVLVNQVGRFVLNHDRAFCCVHNQAQSISMSCHCYAFAFYSSGKTNHAHCSLLQVLDEIGVDALVSAATAPKNPTRQKVQQQQASSSQQAEDAEVEALLAQMALKK